MSSINARKLLYVVIAMAIVFVLGGFAWYYTRPEQRAERKYEHIKKDFFATTPEKANFIEKSAVMTDFLNQNASFLDPAEEAEMKTLLADSLSEINRPRATELLKEVARDSRYPTDMRVRALTYLADHYELDFTDTEFTTNTLFAGDDFGSMLVDAGGNVELAMRKLNEWSNNLRPNLTANYRLALSYAHDVYATSTPGGEKRNALQKINAYLAEGDKIFEEVKSTHAPVRLAIGYGLKARALHLSGGNPSEVERLFRLALKEYDRPPITIFQTVHRSYDTFYYAAFLLRAGGAVNAPRAVKLLQPFYAYLSAPRPPEKRNIRFVSFLAAARDSVLDDYPAADFMRKDVESISNAYPEFGKLIKDLNLREYSKGHPAEAFIK
ncbi:hypothetical protein HY504_03300 [Candidatus Wolfebacteria bacterium]|nr:hypothetical protein [Candidatus Wolfebacteria bacterium]